MRITSGIYKNRRLFVPEGKFVRPTSDRMRQSIFNILRAPKWDEGFTLEDARVIDLFCGSGSLGLEALSNGADNCVFADQDVNAVTNNTGFVPEDNCQIIKTSLPKLPSVLRSQQFDLVFMDPPYHQGLIEPMVQTLVEYNMLAQGAVIVIEMENDLDIDVPLELLDQRFQAQSQLCFYRHMS